MYRMNLLLLYISMLLDVCMKLIWIKFAKASLRWTKLLYMSAPNAGRWMFAFQPFLQAVFTISPKLYTYSPHTHCKYVPPSSSLLYSIISASSFTLMLSSCSYSLALCWMSLRICVSSSCSLRMITLYFSTSMLQRMSMSRRVAFRDAFCQEVRH